MVKRRVGTGFDTDAIAQLSLGAGDQAALGDEVNQLELAGKGLSLDEGIGNTEDMVQHYYDIGKLIGSGEDVSEIPKGPLDDDIEKAMGFGSEGPLGKEIAGMAGLDENENLAESAGYGEAPLNSPGIEDDENLAEYAQGLAELDGSVAEGEMPQTQERSLMGGYNGPVADPGEPDPTQALTQEEKDYIAGGGEITDEILDKIRKASDYADRVVRYGRATGQYPQDEIVAPETQEKVQEAGVEVGPTEEVVATETIETQPVPGAAEEGLQSPEIRNFIELDSGIVLDQASEQQLKDYYNMVNGFASEDAEAAKRVDALRKRTETKDLSKMDMALLGAALLIPTLFAAKSGGTEAMLAAVSKGLEGGVGAFKLGMEQQKSAGKELTDTQKQQVDAQAKRGKITEDFLQTVPDYAVKKELLGKNTYTDSDGNTGVSFGAPNIYFDRSVIHDKEDISAMRKEQPEIKKQINITYNTDRVTNSIDDTIKEIQRVSGNDPDMIIKILTKTAPGKYGPKAYLDGKEVSLAQQLRGQLKQFTTVTEVSGETRYSEQLIESLSSMLKDPTTAILDTTLDDLRAQVQEVKDNAVNKLGIYLDSNGVLVEPVFQGYRTVSPRGKYEPTDKQYQDYIKGLSSKESKELLRKGA